MPGRWLKGKEPGTWWAEALPAAVPLPLNDMGCRVPALKRLVVLLGVCGVVLLMWLLPAASEQVVLWLPVCEGDVLKFPGEAFPSSLED